MSCNNYYKAKLILESNKKRWLKLDPKIPNCSGIYILTREDENGFKYAYVGQAKHILERLAQHLAQYQHIDLSLKKHKLFSESNPHGWKLDYFECLERDMNNLEQEYIHKYANMGYQMRNKTIGSQGVGKDGLNEIKAAKGYYDGVAYGKAAMLKEIKVYCDKYLNFDVKHNRDSLKKNGQIKEIYHRKWQEFRDLLRGVENEERY